MSTKAGKPLYQAFGLLLGAIASLIILGTIILPSSGYQHRTAENIASNAASHTSLSPQSSDDEHTPKAFANNTDSNNSPAHTLDVSDIVLRGTFISGTTRLAYISINNKSEGLYYPRQYIDKRIYIDAIASDHILIRVGEQQSAIKVAPTEQEQDKKKQHL